jgi:hypothetical protein
MKNQIMLKIPRDKLSRFQPIAIARISYPYQQLEHLPFNYTILQ